ncbi:MAG: phosphonate ABC transporter, permease protein PhnE [Pseudomonadota bacterium]
MTEVAQGTDAGSINFSQPATALPSRKRRLSYGFVALTLAFLVVAFRVLDVNPLLLFQDFHYVLGLLGEMLPPALHLLWEKPDVWTSIGETFAMAFLGTVIGALFAFLLAFASARNTTPFPWLRSPCRILLGAQRAAPDFAIMLVIVVAVGFGPFAGTLALIVGSTGMFGKLFADAVESIDARVTDGLWISGASRLQVIRYGVLPQVLPSFVANGLYLFEINLGGAVALGVFGGGGLGFALHIANSTLNYPEMLAYILLIIAMVTITEKCSDALRRRLFAQDKRA